MEEFQAHAAIAALHADGPDGPRRKIG